MAAPLGSTERTNELLAGASKITGIAAPTFPVNKPVDANVPSVLPTGVPTGVESQPSINTTQPGGVDFTVPQKESVPSSALVGGRTVADIMKRRSELEQQFLNASKPTELETGLTEQLNEVKQLSRRAQLDLNREAERLQTTPGLTRDISQQWTSDLARRMQRTIGDLGVGASGLADALNAEISKRKVNIDGATSLMQFDKENLAILKDLQAMTKPDIIGSPNVNEMTGDVTVFKQDPQTGEIVSERIGNVGPSKQYIQSGTYQDAAGNQVFWGLNADKTIETQVMSGGMTNPNGNTVTLPGVGQVNGNAAALAQQYASTGNLPSASELKAAGTTFDEVTNIAQGLPKAPGTLVDKNTGVKSSVISGTQEAGIIALKDAIEKTKALQTMYDEGNRGLFSTDKTRYETLKGEIVDAIARARSGAALTEDEVRMYNAKLPGFRTSIPAFGRTKLEGLASSLDGKLKTTLDTNGVAIYGYSKVKVMGNEYTVGDIIDNGAGQKGRVNPNGTITVEEEPLSFNSAGNASASIQIPQSSRLSYINNNPGNLRFAGQQGAVQGQGGFAKFPTPEAGYEALKRQIRLDASRGLTLEKFISKFAPPTENNTALYIQQVTKQLNASPKTPIARLPLNNLAAAIAKKESNTKLN